MATFAQIKERVSGRLLDPNNTAVSSASVAASINDAIRYWKAKEFFFNAAVSSQTMTAQDGTIPLPSDFFKPQTKTGAFAVEYSSQRYILEKKTPTDYNINWRGNGYGLPRCYARIGQSYEVYPLPDRAYTILVYYLKDYDDLVDNSDTNDFTNNASRLITLWATANLISEFRQDEKMEAYFRNAAMNELNSLLETTNEENSSGSLTVWS